MNVDTGEPAVTSVAFTADHYERRPDDAFGDILVEWNRSSPLLCVWSPATGVVRVSDPFWRSGDHNRNGLLLASGPGIGPGHRAVAIDVVHLAPTLAAAAGVELDDVDGVPLRDLLPEHARHLGVQAPTRGPLPGESLAGDMPFARRWPHGLDVRPPSALEERISALESAHHETRELAVKGDTVARDRLTSEVVALQHRSSELERLASITTTTAWLRHQYVEPTLFVSVVTPTRNRSERLREAIESVRRQTYEWWEMLVVDDGSSDETWELLQKEREADGRIRPFRCDHRGVSAARNHALERADGRHRRIPRRRQPIRSRVAQGSGVDVFRASRRGAVLRRPAG